ncbi:MULTISPECIES: helicase-associated domain-containing protein [Paenibacillus]|uniref:helicase-associated domain-containing protein n=1 Tax=Paenibacillus TaxID=44249 RepID=UPI00203A9CBB|nr:helicase-associated domain-containing protein [Paenibacillus lactis]MCM3495447.1 helicase-associated domain-containing protein [Paenibacillus lactis]
MTAMGDHERGGTASLDQLRPLERTVLSFIWRRFAGRPFSDDHLRTLIIPRLSGAEVQLGVLLLRRRGWIKAASKGWNEWEYCIPFHKLGFLQSSFGGLQAVPSAGEPSKLLQEGRAGISLDVFNTLVYAEKTSLAVTSRGVLHKKHIRRLEEIAALSPNDLDPAVLRFTQHEAYPPQIALILDLLQSLGLAAIQRHGLIIDRRALGEWLELSREAMDNRILFILMERCTPENPAYQHFVWRLCDPSLTCGRWIDPGLLLSDSHDGSQKEDGAGTISRLHAGEAFPWLRLLAGCGYIDLGENDDGRIVFRWRMTPLPALFGGFANSEAGSGRLYIQPDFDILIPPDVPYTLRFQAALFTERLSDDVMSVYRLTRDSVMEAARAGIGPEQIIQLLEKGAAAGFPDHVRTAIVQWGMGADDSENRPGHRLQLGNADLADGADGGSSRYPLPWSLDSAAAVITERAGSIGEAENEPDEVDERLPDIRSLLPDLTRIPAMWTKDWRAYHSSTAKQMMEQALALSVKLEISINGRRMEFIPRELGRNPWTITGALFPPGADGPESIVQLSEGQWREMRLLIPGSV